MHSARKRCPLQRLNSDALRQAPARHGQHERSTGKAPTEGHQAVYYPEVNAPAADRSPAAKIQALRDDGSDPLTPHLMPSSSKMPEELGPSDLLMGSAATTSEAEQVPETMPCKISSTHETTTAQIIPEHNQKPYIPSMPWTGALECTWPAQTPLPARFRDAIPSSTTPPPPSLLPSRLALRHNISTTLINR